MLAASRERILSSLADGAVVLDVGGWGKPFERADWVVDLMPHETRGLYAPDDYDRAAERFSADTWLRFDICDREPWPFEDGKFDFAICSHTLEDVRDPIWVCSELNRIAGAGYVEVPSRLEEQCLGVHGPWAGWSHHRWLVDRKDGGLRFAHKSHVVHTDERFHLPAGSLAGVPAEERVEAYFWQGELSAFEEIFVEAAEHDRYLAEPVQAAGAAAGPARGSRPPSRLRELRSAVARRTGRER